MTSLPNLAFDGQTFVDAYRVKWSWDAESQLWFKIGPADAIPNADESTTGLLSPAGKIALDATSSASGGFGFITGLGMVSGDIVLRSESFDVAPVDKRGNVLDVSGIVSMDDAGSSGFELSVSTPYLRSLCVEFLAPPGPIGKDGEIGDKGQDGFNNSPIGLQGIPGFDAADFKDFNGIKLLDLDELHPEAIVNMELDSAGNFITCTKAVLNIPDNDKPAEQLNPTPITRQLLFQLGEGDCKSTLDDWVIKAPSSDPLADNPDVYLLKTPDSVEVGDVIDVEPVKLSELITGITNYYKEHLIKCDESWQVLARDFISSKDALAREALSNLAQKLAECEFARPLDFCLGVKLPSPSPSLSMSVSASPSSSLAPSASPSPSPADILRNTVILCIYDESDPYYTDSTTAYETDLEIWNNWVQRLIESGLFKVRAGVLQPCTYLPSSTSTYLDEKHIYCKDDGCDLPRDSDRTKIDVIQFRDNVVINSPDPNRVTADRIIDAVDRICRGGYDPTTLIFILDDSGSLNLMENYGGPGASGGDPPALALAKSRLLTRYPGLNILNNIETTALENWLEKMKTAIDAIMASLGVNLP